MSEYFQVLKRLENEAATSPSEQADAARVTRRLAVAKPSALPATRPSVDAEPLQPAPSAAPVGAAALTTLFDNLRARAGGQPLRSVVFAATAAAVPVHPLTAALCDYAERHGVTSCLMRLADAAGRLTLQPVGNGTSAARLSLSGWNEAWAREFAQLRAVVPADLLLIEGRPLDQGLDSVWLARCCDGLVIVVQPGVTLRQDLRETAERVRSAGCRVLGLVAQ